MYSLTGWTQAPASEAFGGAVRYATTAGSSAKFSFKGGHVGWISTRGPDRGQAQMLVDGSPVGTVDLYSATAIPRQTVFTRAVDATRSHALEVRVLSTKHASSSGFRVDVDAFLAAVTTTADNQAPVVSAPLQSLAVPSQMGATVPVKVSWSGNDGTGTGITRYEMHKSIDGGKTWTNVPLPPFPATSNTIQLAPDSSAYKFRLRAQDLVANWSAWKFGATFAAGNSRHLLADC